MVSASGSRSSGFPLFQLNSGRRNLPRKNGRQSLRYWRPGLPLTQGVQVHEAGHLARFVLVVTEFCCCIAYARACSPSGDSRACRRATHTIDFKGIFRDLVPRRRGCLTAALSSTRHRVLAECVPFRHFPVAHAWQSPPRRIFAGFGYHHAPHCHSLPFYDHALRHSL